MAHKSAVEGRKLTVYHGGIIQHRTCHRITDSQLGLLGPGGIAKKIVLLWFSRPSGELCERMPHQLVWFYGTAVLSLEAVWCEQQTQC